MFAYRQRPPFEEAKFPSFPAEERLWNLLQLAITLCHRNTQLVLDSEYEMLWFQLLDAVYDRAQRYAQDYPHTPTKTSIQKSKSLEMGLSGTRWIGFHF